MKTLRKDPSRRSVLKGGLATLVAGAASTLFSEDAEAEGLDQYWHADLLNHPDLVDNPGAMKMTNGTPVEYPPEFSNPRISSGFTSRMGPDGKTFRPNNWELKYHFGLDIGSTNDIVISPCDGEIEVIDGTNRYGNHLALLVSPRDMKGSAESPVNNEDPRTYYSVSFVHLKNHNGKHSAYEFLDLSKSNRVERGQPLAIVGRTGRVLRGLPGHVHVQVYSKFDASYSRWVDEEGATRTNFDLSVLRNPHNLWAPHELDVPGEVKYIPYFDPKRPGKNYSPGFTYMVKKRTDEIISAPPESDIYPVGRDHRNR